MGTKTVKHKLLKSGSTVCAPYRKVGFGSSIRGNLTWRGITCKKCLKRREVAIRELKVGTI